MSDPIYDGAVQVQGAFRGYGNGRIRNLTTAIRHYTVGANSLGTCGRDFQMLQSRSGVLYQGAEVDAINWGAGDPWNGCSVHIEAEWHPVLNADEPILNDAMVASLRPFCAWLESEWGISRASSYDGPTRVTAWSGFIDHRWLIQTGDWHTNFWPDDQWARVAAPEPAPRIEDRMKPILCVQPDGKVVVYDPNAHTKTWVRSPAALSSIQALRALEGLSTDIVRNDATDNVTSDARWVEDTPSATAGGGNGGPLTVQLSGTAVPA